MIETRENGIILYKQGGVVKKLFGFVRATTRYLVLRLLIHSGNWSLANWLSTVLSCKRKEEDGSDGHSHSSVGMTTTHTDEYRFIGAKNKNYHINQTRTLKNTHTQTHKHTHTHLLGPRTEYSVALQLNTHTLSTTCLLHVSSVSLVLFAHTHKHIRTHEHTLTGRWRPWWSSCDDLSVCCLPHLLNKHTNKYR